MVDAGHFIEVFAEAFSTTEAARFMTDQNGSREKKGYEPPKITVISLRPEEAVLGNCKNASSSGPAGAACNQIAGGACHGHGS